MDFELRHSFKKIVKQLLKYFFSILLKANVFTPKVVVRMDGGICSQMHFFLIGQLFHKKGWCVEYDLSWFKNGKDLTGCFERNFDLLKLFPNLKFEKASYLTLKIYSFLFNCENDYFSDKKLSLTYLNLIPPVYLSGYYQDPLSLYTVDFKQYFHVSEDILNERNLLVLNNIQKYENSVAIHVRRGDLSQYLEAYGHPASIHYFYEAISYFNKKYNECFYFIFSDEPEWCRAHLVEELPIDNKYQIVDVNGSDKGYMDLVLISKCRHKIASKGSLGKYGSLLSTTFGDVVVCDDASEKEWREIIPNALCFSI